jgi:histidinol-phosphate aminotransferase
MSAHRLPPPSPAVAGMTPYHVPRHPAPLDLLLDGIGGLTPPADLFRGLDDADPETLVRQYPSAAPLVADLAARLGLPPERVMATAGGDDALDRLCRAWLAPGRSIVLPVPTFEMIPRYATWAGAEIREVPWTDETWPLDAVLARVDATTTLIAVVSPNNPSGQVITPDQLRALSAAAPHALLLVDLAYVEFADDDLSPLVASLPNAVGFRTLSKAFGLAGLRVGYAFGPAEVIAVLRAAGNPYTLSGPSLHLARRQLAQSGETSRAFIGRVRAQRDALTATLRSLGVPAQRSQANFVFARTPRALWIRDALAGLGIGVRAWPGHPTLSDAVRINVPGDDAIFARVEHALRAALAPEALLLDMDGVMVDVGGSYRAAIVATAAHFGAVVTDDDVRAAKAAGGANNDWVLTQRLLAERGVDMPLATVTEAFEARYQGTPEAPGLKSTERDLLTRAQLERLAGAYRLAVVTGRPRRDAWEVLERSGIADLFSAVVVMEDGPPKPDPFPVQHALRTLGVTHAWMVGDTVDDVRAARAAGVVPVGVVPPGEPAERVTPTLLGAGAARVLAHTADLLELMPC